ncbi:MAG: replicative DNA helicase [Clostridia bacterium]|nr:replicative DNA helicase [Clostridia bacterium]
MDSITRKLPFSLEAEQSVLGSILVKPDSFNEVAGILRHDDFYLDEHKEIFLAMQDLYLQNRDIDYVTLIDMMVARGIYDDEQSKNYIRLITEVVPSAKNVRDYAKIVKDKSLLRQLINASDEIGESAYSEQGDVETILDHAEQTIFNIAENNETKGFVHIKDVLIQTYDHLQQLRENKSDAIGTPTGYSDIDRIMVGMGKSDLILVGARPGMGKTSFALNIATNVAKSTKKAVCVFSLEMSNEQLVTRMLSSEALVDSHALRSGEITGEQWTKLAQAAAMLSECDVYIDDTTGITVTGMKAKLRRIKNLGLVIIDYLQLMQSDKRIDNRVQEVGEISRNLKILAKELMVPVIVCAQLSRGPESRTDKRPMLSDLRDSGAIEQDADIVMFLYRDEYYDSDPEKANTAECILAKNRHGSTGNISLGWQGEFTRFYSRDTERQEPGAPSSTSGTGA